VAPSTTDMYLNQIAISTRGELDDALAWWIEGLGFLPAGGAEFGGPEIAQVQGIDVPTVELTLKWLVDRNDFLQIEYFKYAVPETRPVRPDWTPADVGYNVLGVYVVDFDEALANLAAIGSEPIGPVVGTAGDRRVCVTDPSAVVVELMERDVEIPGQDMTVRHDVGAGIRFVRGTVPDLARASTFFVDTLGLTRVDTKLHDPEHEALWGLAGATTESVTAVAGNCLLELVTYEGIGRGWPDGYRTSDEGILNIAFGSLTPEPFHRVRERVAAGPNEVHADFVYPPDLEVNYATDPEGFNVELMYMAPSMHAEFGFIPTTAGA
jgi:catechol 2,3-dioxygenase-like lactoylglutathione lyase family enzyme